MIDLKKPTNPPFIKEGHKSNSRLEKGGGRGIFLTCIFLLLFISCDSQKSSVTNIPAPGEEKSSAKTSSDTGSGETAPPTATEKEATGKGSETASKNSPPVIAKVQLKPERIDNVDSLKVLVEGKGTEATEVTFKYEWSKNGESAGDDSSTFTGFKRGDRISVRVTPYEGKIYGPSKTITMVIANLPPKITEHKDLVSTGEVFSYQVKATDPDGDTLSYSLKSLPTGMTIDPVTGLIKWNVPADFIGKAAVTVSVTDGHGGEAFQVFTVDVKTAQKRP